MGVVNASFANSIGEGEFYVSKSPFGRSKNQVEDSNKPYAAKEMHDIVREAALPAKSGEPVVAAIRRAAQQLNIPYARARGYWYEQVRLVPAQEADTLREWRRNWKRKRREALHAELVELEREWVGDDE
jgi:hypothetical protein